MRFELCALIFVLCPLTKLDLEMKSWEYYVQKTKNKVHPTFSVASETKNSGVTIIGT